METSSSSPTVSLAKKQRLWLRWFKYLSLGVLANGVIWGVSWWYLKNTPPTYTSEMLLNVAGSGPGVNVNLPDIGQAYTSGSSAFGSASSDPRENYKLISSSPTVLNTAAQALKMSAEDFGEPKIKIINNTTMLQIEVKGDSPEDSQAKATALHQALDRRLISLRQIEQAERDRAIQKALADAEKKLTQTQGQLSAYKAQSGLNSSDQLKDLINNIEQFRKQRSEAIAQERQVRERLQQLSLNLGLTPQEAADALVLQTDQQFQQSLKKYTTATTNLELLLPNRGPNYPDVISAKQKQQAALQLLLERGQTLLGKPVEQLTLERLSLDNSNGSGVQRSELFQQLVTLQSEHQGLVGQVTALTDQLGKLEERLNLLSQKESTLEGLLRELQIAEAIFASTLAKVDLGKGDPFGSFPLVQVIEEPTLPDEPSSPKTKLVLAGSALGSVLVTLGLTLIWWRNPLLAATKKVLREILA